MSIQQTDMTAVAEDARSAWANVGPAIEAMARYRKISQLRLALATGAKRTTLINWLGGSLTLPGWFGEAAAEAVGCPLEVLKLGPGDALRWALDHPEARGAAASGTSRRGGSGNRCSGLEALSAAQVAPKFTPVAA